jgi:hypothetical protein
LGRLWEEATRPDTFTHSDQVKQAVLASAS